MTITEQRTIRLSIYHIKILEQIQESLGLNFSDVIRHLIAGHDQQNREDVKNIFLLKQLAEKIDRITGDIGPRSNNLDSLVSDQLNRIENDICVIKKAIGIIGSSDPRTKALIANLLNGET